MAAVLGSALAGLAKKDVAEKLASGFKDMKDAATNSTFAETFKIMNEFGVNIQPLLAPLSLITSQISAATTPAVIEGMKELMELIQQPAVQTIIEKISELFIFWINNLVTILDGINKIIDLLEESPKWAAFCNACKDLYDLLVDGLTEKWQELIGIFTGSDGEGGSINPAWLLGGAVGGAIGAATDENEDTKWWNPFTWF